MNTYETPPPFMGLSLGNTFYALLFANGLTLQGSRQVLSSNSEPPFEVLAPALSPSDWTIVRFYRDLEPEQNSVPVLPPLCLPS